MVHFNSLYPLLESYSEVEESYGTEASTAEVFMANTPPPVADNVDAAAADAAGGGDGGAAARVIADAKHLLNTPIAVTTPENIVLEAARLPNLAERNRLAQLQRTLEVRDHETAGMSRQPRHCPPSLIRRGQNVHDTLATGNSGEFHVS